MLIECRATLEFVWSPARRPASRDPVLLVQWLDANAVLEDVENLMFMLCEVRSRFSLRNLSPSH